jgi:hypothetical protein
MDVTSKEFKKCPDCGSEETVAFTLTKGKFNALEKIIVATEQPILAVASVKAICVDFDVCWNCGRRRCTKAEIISVPIQFQGPPPPQSSGLLRR